MEWTETDTLYLFNDLLTGISLLCASTVLIIIIMIRIYDKDLVNRISLKICAAISAVDIFRSSSYLIYIYHVEDDLLCKLNGIFLNFIILSHMLLTFSIALNLQLVFIHNIKYQSNWQYYYWVLGFLIPILITAVMVGLGVFGLDTQVKACFYKDVYPLTLYSGLTMYLGFLGWNIIGCLYCFFISLFIIYHLKRKTKDLIGSNYTSTNQYSSDTFNNPPKLSVNSGTISLLIQRICIYCVIPMITQSGCIIGLIYEQIYGEIPYYLILWDTIATHLSGILNLLGFLFDPAFKNSLLHIRYHLFNKHKLYQSRHEKQQLSQNAFELMAKNKQDSQEFRMIDKIFSFILLRGEYNLNNVSKRRDSTPNEQMQDIIQSIKKSSGINDDEEIIEGEQRDTNLENDSKVNNYFSVVKGL